MKDQGSKELIKILKDSKLQLICPLCRKEHSIQSLTLFENDKFTEEAQTIFEKQLEYIHAKKTFLQNLKKQGASKSLKAAKAINLGFILERIAPTLDSFKFNPNDCRSLFDPIDYIIFNGLTKNKKIDEVLFVDIKTGDAKLSKKQKEIKKIVEEKKVRFITY